MLTLAGAILLGLGLPITVGVAFVATNPHAGVSPWMPVIVGGPLILLGYGACAYAAKRYAEAKKLEGGARGLPKKKQRPSVA